MRHIEKHLEGALAFNGVVGAGAVPVDNQAACVIRVERSIKRTFRSLSHDFIRAEEELVERGGIKSGTHSGTTASVVLLYKPFALCDKKLGRNRRLFSPFFRSNLPRTSTLAPFNIGLTEYLAPYASKKVNLARRKYS